MIFEEVHPGRILKRELHARDLSAAALAFKLRIANAIAGEGEHQPQQATRDFVDFFRARIERETEQQQNHQRE